MMLIWGIGLVFVVVIWGLAFVRAPLWTVALAFIVLLMALQQAGTLSLPVSVFVSVLIAVFLGLFYCPWFRRDHLIEPLFFWFKQKLPMMSSTEREAIQAGDLWFEGELFQGNPNWDRLLALPAPSLSIEELQFLKNQVENLCGMIDDWTVSHKTLDLPQNVWNYLKKERFFGMIIPKEQGGLGFSALAHSTVIQKIATHSITGAITAMVPNSLGPAELLIRYGTDEQKKQYLNRLAVGEEIPCFALTSQEAGSDASALTDIGIVCEGEYQGKKVIGMRLTFNKRYITLAPVATVLGLAFKLYDPDRLLGEKQELGITLCLIPTNHRGVEIGLRHFPLNQAFLNGPLRGKDVFVPLDWIIGGKEMIGKGWHMLVECLSAGRGISLPALSAALAKVCYRGTGAYAKIRQQFRLPIGHFEGVESAMAKIAGYTYLIESARFFTLTPIDRHIQPAIVSAIAKYHMTEMGRIVMNHAMDVHAGRGIMLGPNNYLGKAYESLPISVTVEGANILTRSLIIFGQGAIRCHPYVQQEIEAIGHPKSKTGIALLDKVLWKHCSYSISNFAKLLFHGLTARIFCTVPKRTKLEDYYGKISYLSIALSFASDISLIILGGKLKRYERLSARLGDVLSHLYLASGVLKYYRDFNSSHEDWPYVVWCLKTCLTKAEEALLRFCRNFPVKILGFLFERLIFPYGRCERAPDDRLEHQLAASMMVPSPFRDRLTQQGYFDPENKTPLTHLDKTLEKLLRAEPVLAKLEDAVKRGLIAKWLDKEVKIQKAFDQGILSNSERDQLLAFERARIEAIRVDEFTQEQLIGK